MPTLDNTSIFFDEEENSPTGSVDIANRRIIITRTGFSNWGDINAIYNYLMAPTLVFGELFGISAGAAYAGNSNLRCVNAKFVPADTTTGADVNGVNTHATAHWTITYSNITGQPNQQNTQDPVTLLTHEWDIGGEWFTSIRQATQWAKDNVHPGSEFRGGIFIPTQEISITWPRLTIPPFQAIRALTGKVNNAAMTFDTGVMAFETALFLGAKVRRDFMSDGSLGWAFTYKFSQRQVVAADVGTSYAEGIGTQSNVGGWNHFFRANSTNPGFYRLWLTQDVAGGSSRSLYQHGDFTKLFQVDQPVSEEGT